MAKKLTHEEFLHRLNNNKIILLSKYVNARIKIKYICTCGSTDEAEPKSLLRGSLCKNCGYKKNRNKKTTSEYMQDLVNTNIQVLEEYKGKDVPIEHLCFCNNKFLAKPNSILTKNTTSCGCNKIYYHTRSYFKDKETTLYYIKIGKLYKIGITTKTIKERYKYEGVVYEIIKERKFKDGSNAWDKELEIKRKFRNKLYLGEQIMKYTRNTELFIEDINPQF